MVKIRPQYTSLNMTPAHDQSVKVLMLTINGEFTALIGFNYFFDVSQDMPVKIGYSTTQETIYTSGYLTGIDSENFRYIVEYDDLSNHGNYHLNESLDNFVWADTISAIDFLELTGDNSEWDLTFDTGDIYCSPYLDYGFAKDGYTKKGQLALVSFYGEHKPSHQFKNEISDFFDSIPVQQNDFRTGFNLSGIVTGSGVTGVMVLENFLSGMGITGVNNNYNSGSGDFSGYLSYDAYSSGQGFTYLHNTIVGQHVIFYEGQEIYSSSAESIDGNVVYDYVSIDELSNYNFVDITNPNLLSGGFKVCYSGTGY